MLVGCDCVQLFAHVGSGYVAALCRVVKGETRGSVHYLKAIANGHELPVLRLVVWVVGMLYSQSFSIDVNVFLRL